MTLKGHTFWHESGTKMTERQIIYVEPGQGDPSPFDCSGSAAGVKDKPLARSLARSLTPAAAPEIGGLRGDGGEKVSMGHGHGTRYGRGPPGRETGDVNSTEVSPEGAAHRSDDRICAGQGLVTQRRESARLPGNPWLAVVDVTVARQRHGTTVR